MELADERDAGYDGPIPTAPLPYVRDDGARLRSNSPGHLGRKLCVSGLSPGLPFPYIDRPSRGPKLTTVEKCYGVRIGDLRPGSVTYFTARCPSNGVVL